MQHGFPFYAISSVTGAGIEALRYAISSQLFKRRARRYNLNRKLDSAGAGPGLQNRSAALMLSRVGSTPISFRKLFITNSLTDFSVETLGRNASRGECFHHVVDCWRRVGNQFAFHGEGTQCANRK